MNIAKLQEYRGRSGLTYEQIAESTGVSLRTVTTVFTNPGYNPTIETIVPIVALLEASLDDICDLPQATADLLDPSGNVNTALLDKLFREHTHLLVETKSHTHEVRRWLKTSVALNIAFLALIVFVVIFDLTHPTMGYVQYTVQAITGAWNRITEIFTI